MAASFDFEAPDFFTTGTVGVPGRRTFYLQAREAGNVVTLKLEKEQIRALAEYLAKLLNDLPKPGALPRDMALLEPVSEAWVVGSLGVAYDESADRILIVAEELTEETEEDEDEEDDEPAEGTTVEESPRSRGRGRRSRRSRPSPRVPGHREGALPPHAPAGRSLRGARAQASSRRDGPRAGSAGCPSIPTATPARARTGTSTTECPRRSTSSAVGPSR